MKNGRSILCRWLGCNKPKPRVTFAFGIAQPKQKDKPMIEVGLTNEQKITATLKITTETGKPAAIDGKPQWTVVSGDSMVQPSADGMSAEIISSDAPGDTHITVVGDADIGEGVEEIADEIVVHVKGARARFLGISFGQPEPKG